MNKPYIVFLSLGKLLLDRIVFCVDFDLRPTQQVPFRFDPVETQQ
jgi:hypothetical protein